MTHITKFRITSAGDSVPGEIVTDIPIPSRTGVSDCLRRLRASPVGASVFIPVSWVRHQSTFGVVARRIAGPGWMRSSKVDGGWRVWRVS